MSHLTPAMGRLGQPVMHAQERPTWAADLWAAGLCFHCCLVGELPLHGAEAMKLLRCWDSKVKRKSCCLPAAAFKDTYGWVKPDTAIAHPCAAARWKGVHPQAGDQMLELVLHRWNHLGQTCARKADRVQGLWAWQRCHVSLMSVRVLHHLVSRVALSSCAAFYCTLNTTEVFLEALSIVGFARLSGSFQR
jgi:hypothetical protein